MYLQKIYKNQKLSIIYEIFIAIFALIAVTLAFLDLTGRIIIENSIELYWLDTSILVIFAIDYFTRLFIAKDRKKFFKDNILDFIAIIPFNSLFRVFRIARLFRLARLTRVIKITKITKMVRIIRIFTFGKRFKNKADKFFNTNGFIYIVYITITTIILGAVGIYFTEKAQTISNFGDAIWWSFVTATTVGYGDISPATALGRFIAAILMLVGIGFIGMLTGTIATYFLNKTEKNEVKKNNNKVIDLSDLDDEKFNQALSYIEFLKTKDN